MLKDVPWAQDHLGRNALKAAPKENSRQMFKEEVAGHSTDRIHKFDIFKAQKNHTGLASAVSGGLLGSKNDEESNPHKVHFDTNYKQYAGVRSGVTGKARKHAMSQKSVMDEIILGRDIDGSGDNVHEEFMAGLNEDAAGCRSRPETGRARRPGLPLQDSMDKTLHGETIAPAAKKAWLERQRKSMIEWDDDAAGMSRWDVAKFLADKEKEKIATAQRRGTVVGGVVFGKDIAYDENYEETYRDVPGMDPSSAMRVLVRNASPPSARDTSRTRKSVIDFLDGGAPAAGQRRR